MAELFKVEQCRSCHQPVIWAVTTGAKTIPVDAEPPLAGGNISLEHRGPGVQPLARVLTPTQLATTSFGRKDLRTPHFQRCPDADRWRSKARRRAGGA